MDIQRNIRSFAPPALVNDRAEVSENHIRGTLNQSVVNGLELFSFAMPHNRSSLSDHCAVPVTGVLNCKKPLRLPTVQSVFHYLPGRNADPMIGYGESEFTATH